MNNQVCILLGGNLGQKKQNLETASKYISKKIGTIHQKSSLYKSDAWGFESNDYFLNQVIIIETELDAFEILKQTQEIEKIIGRKEKTTAQKYASRLIDIDILFFNNDIIESKYLCIPHPRLHERNFTLLPLNELLPNYIHPKIKKSILYLYSNSKDKGKCYKL